MEVCNMVRFAGNISTNVKHSANNILLEFSQIKLWGLSQMTSSPKGEGVSEMLTKPDMGGLTNDDVSKKGHFAAIATNANTRIPNF